MEGFLFIFLVFWLISAIGKNQKKKIEQTQKSQFEKVFEQQNHQVQDFVSKHASGLEQKVANAVQTFTYSNADSDAEAAERARRAVAMHDTLKKREKERKKRKKKATQAEGTMVSGSIEMPKDRHPEGLSTYVPIQPRVEDTQTRMTYQGSLDADSTEGEDTCDASLEHYRPNRETAPANAYTSQAPIVSFDSKALLQGVILSEVLARPCDRKWGRIGRH